MAACSVYDATLLSGEKAAEAGGGAGFGGQGPSGDDDRLPSSEVPRGGSGGSGGGGGAPSSGAGAGGAGGGAPGGGAGSGGVAGAGGGGGSEADLHPVYCELRPPTYACLNPGGKFSSSGQIYVFGRTDQNTPGEGIEAEFGFGPEGSDPRVVSDGWVFRVATRDVGFDLALNNDQYQYTFVSDAGNTTERGYGYLFRFRIDGGDWMYCDGDGTGGVEGFDFTPSAMGYVEITNEPCAPL
jgi:hypothetical protein